MKASLAFAAASTASAMLLRGPQLRGKPMVGSGGCTTGVNTFDYFMLTTQWDITECMDVYSCQNSNQFTTLHGLWPNDLDGNYPCFCTNEAFNGAVLAPIMDSMNTYWPSLNGANSDFWSHEWSKHGTCSNLPSQYDYFATALTLRTKFDPIQAMTAAGYPPSNTAGFTLDQFHTITRNAYGGAAVVDCDSNGNIQSVVQCLDTSFNAMDCPSNNSDSCSASTIYFPSSMSSTA